MKNTALFLNGKKSERGAALLIFAGLITVLMAMCALVLGLGMIAADKIKVENIANVAALAALEEFQTKYAKYQRDPAEPDPVEHAGSDSLARVNLVLERNSRGAAGSGWTALAPDAGNPTGITLGGWFSKKPTGSDPCGAAGKNYPCFVGRGQGAGAMIDAVKVRVGNKPSNPIVAPFAAILGEDKFFVAKEVIATMTPRCVYFLLDVSNSVVGSTHKPNAGKLGIPWNPGDGRFAYPLGVTEDPALYLSWDPSIRASTYFGKTLPDPYGARPLSAANDFAHHYRSDYTAVDTPLGRYLVDTYIDPMPLTAFLRGFNAGIDQIRGQLVGGDHVGILAFDTGTITDTGLLPADQLDIALQLTNVKNRGTRTLIGDGSYAEAAPELRPSFMDWGWFPRGGNSNLTGAIVTAAKMLADSSMGCPSEARKMIVMASDGLANCISSSNGSVSCDDSYGGYMSAENDILDSSRSGWGPGFAGSATIMEFLTRTRTSFSMMLSGEYVRPHFLNLLRNPPIAGAPSVFLSAGEAGAIGYKGIGTPGFFNIAPSANHTNQDDFDAMNQPGRFFRRVNGLWGQLVLGTSGVWCPLMAQAPSSDYDSVSGVLKDSARTSGGEQLFALHNEDLPHQAMRCVNEVIGGNPYTLVTE